MVARHGRQAGSRPIRFYRGAGARRRRL